ncbi:AsnC family transcriptional regulator [Pseudaminobacter salicylatoxidans]|uniref:AsnC family transcriptional regulator n=1 Tax=Pseudaminobacter salicylatoxidans TaxID=93369 RepID=A0A316C9Q9_PSESE|nr:Lrp/AsnC family transcriptional regulator [Pseudaminobacter salicylatoxidans]PWJ86501.1 AsnC family transcriptional regulator [Pseudaminobacter salicylatoxidans]
MQVDDFDKKILCEIQKDASLSVSAIAERVSLSPTPCWRRLQRLEREGFIDGRVTLLNQERVGLELTVFVMIRTNQHNRAWLERFNAAVGKFPEIVEVNRLAGEYDYLLKVITRNNAAYDTFYKNFIDEIELSDVTSCFSMEQIKYSTELPLGVIA